jgi:hypothetical protein
MVHLVPSRVNYNAQDVAELVFAEVYKHHRLPCSIMSDWDVLFTSVFWTHLNRLLGVEQQMLSAYHPKSDGTTERANHTVVQMLRSCIPANQQDWVVHLPAIEFTINLAQSESTSLSLFLINNGQMPHAMVWNDPQQDEYPGVRTYLQRMKEAQIWAHNLMLEARVKQTHNANSKCQPCPFKEGDLTYVSTKNILFPKGLARKLLPKYVGPYKIIQDYGNNSFCIDLPDHLKQ